MDGFNVLLEQCSVCFPDGVSVTNIYSPGLWPTACQITDNSSLFPLPSSLVPILFPMAVGSWKLEAGSWKLEVGSLHPIIFVDSMIRCFCSFRTRACMSEARAGRPLGSWGPSPGAILAQSTRATSCNGPIGFVSKSMLSSISFLDPFVLDVASVWECHFDNCGSLVAPCWCQNRLRTIFHSKTCSSTKQYSFQ